MFGMGITGSHDMGEDAETFEGKRPHPVDGDQSLGISFFPSENAFPILFPISR